MKKFVALILIFGFALGTANANSHLPDCKADTGCLLELGGKWETVTVAELQAMIDAGADVNAKTDGGNTPLHSAAVFGKAEMIPILVKAGADVNAKDEYDNTPLHLAVFKGIAEVIGNTPLHLAVFKGNVEVISVLVKAGADVNAKGFVGWTPLHTAARTGQTEVISILVQARADVNAKTDGGWTPLHRAALWGKIEVIPVLVKAGADVNAKEDNGETPLHLAAWEGHAEVIPVLIKHGAYIQATDNAGRTPLDVAREYKEWNAVKILEGGSGLASPSCFNIIRSKPEQIVQVNGVAMTLLVDTGASITQLTHQQAETAAVRITGEGEFTIADGSVVVNKIGSANISLGGGLSGKFPVSIGKGKGLLGRDVLDEFACQ